MVEDVQENLKLDSECNWKEEGGLQLNLGPFEAYGGICWSDQSGGHCNSLGR